MQSLKRRRSMGFKATLFSQEHEVPNNSRQLLTIEKIPFFISPFLNSIFILLNIRIRFTTLLTMLLTYTVITIQPVTYGLLNTLLTVFTILSGCIHFSSITNRYVLRQSSIYLQIFNKIESLSLTFFFCLSCIPAPSNTKSCKKPTPPPNAHLRLASQALREWFSNGERVYYQCNTGYSQTGFFIQRCSKGQWLPAKSLLTCIG